MKSGTCTPVAAVSAALLVATPTLSAQQVVEVTDRDRHIEPDFEEVYRVGVIEGETWEMFADVKRVGFDAAGNLYVFDRSGGDNSGDARIVVFDRTGAFVREFGSAGEGPGEFKDPYDIVIQRDGTTVVEDNGHDAYQVFDPSGSFVRMVRMAETDSKLVVLTDVFGDPRGGAVYKPGHGGGESDAHGSRPVTRLGLAGEVVDIDTVALGWLPPRGDEAIKAEIEVLGGAFSLSDAFKGVVMPAEFEPELLMGVMPDGGLVYSDSSAYALKITHAGYPEVRRVITRPLRPEPVTESIKKEFSEKRAGRRTRSETTSATTDRGERVPIGLSLELPEPTFSPEIPVLRGLSTTWEGSIWVQRRGKEPESDGPIDILTAEGDYLGTFRTDATRIPDAFGPDGLAAFIELDEFDVASVVVRRLPTAIR